MFLIKGTANTGIQLLLGSCIIVTVASAAPKLYMIPPSPPVRAVQMTAKAIGLDLDFEIVNIMEGDNLKPEYLKMNPQHTVPTLVDQDGFTVWDSHAIMIYLVDKYAKDDSLYPKDPKKRAIINQRLHFDSGILFVNFRAIVTSIMQGKGSVDEAAIAEVNVAYGFMEAFLEDSPWFAGDSVTLADISIFSSLSSLDILISVCGKKYPKLSAWKTQFEKLPVSQENTQGLGILAAVIKSKLQ